MIRLSVVIFFVCLSAFTAKSQSSVLHVGDSAPEISLQTPDGHTVTLSSLRGRVLLVDFWATWCAPCLEEQKELKIIYNKHRSEVNKGHFEILGVSLDKHKNKWINGIKNLKISWPQVSDLKYWQSPVAKTYGIEVLPFNVLIKPDGTIAAIDVHGTELINRISRLLD